MVALASNVYERLTEKWSPEETFSRSVGGVDLTYISGEQAITRLNQVLGVGNWSFDIVEHGLNVEADEVWVLGQIEASFPDEEDPRQQRMVRRQQFGSQKIKRRRDTGIPLDFGFDLKGATTDSLKKCASLLGVGLYLSERSSRADSGGQFTPPPQQVNGQAPRRAPQAGPSQASRMPADLQASRMPADLQNCVDCGAQLQTIRFRNGEEMSPQKMADMSLRKFGRVLCMTHYKELNDQRKAAGGADPFGGPVPEHPITAMAQEDYEDY